MVLEIINAIINKYRHEQSKKQPSRIEVAKTVGIRNPYSIDKSIIPMEDYIENNGLVVCERTDQPPNPPKTIVARYTLPTGDRKVLAHSEYAEVLRDHYNVDHEEAEVLARHRAGWDMQDLTDIETTRDPAKILDSARMKLESDTHR
jgi:hypothetical protein